MTLRQEIVIREFTLTNKATVTARQELPNDQVVVTYSVPEAPAQESLSAHYLPEWAEVRYSSHGAELDFKSSWDERRRIRSMMQAAQTGSLVIETTGERTATGMIFR